MEPDPVLADSYIPESVEGRKAVEAVDARRRRRRSLRAGGALLDQRDAGPDSERVGACIKSKYWRTLFK